MNFINVLFYLLIAILIILFICLFICRLKKKIKLAILSVIIYSNCSLYDLFIYSKLLENLILNFQYVQFGEIETLNL